MSRIPETRGFRSFATLGRRREVLCTHPRNWPVVGLDVAGSSEYQGFSAQPVGNGPGKCQGERSERNLRFLSHIPLESYRRSAMGEGKINCGIHALFEQYCCCTAGATNRKLIALPELPRWHNCTGRGVESRRSYFNGRRKQSHASGEGPAGYRSVGRPSDFV